MGFTEWLESLKSLGDVARILAGLGIVTVFLAYLKHVLERRCWRNYKKSVHDWVEKVIESQNRHPNEFQEEEWQAVCERMLTDANLPPSQVKQLLEVSVIVAKGIVADKVFR